MQVLTRHTKKVGGLEWPASVPDATCHMIVARFGWVPNYWWRHLGERKTVVELGGEDPRDAVCRAVELVFDKSEFELNPWSVRMLHAAAGPSSEAVVIGPASSGKSETMAVFTLLSWAPAPKNTAIMFVSTTVPQLRRRSFGAVAKYHSILKRRHGYPGVYVKQLNAVVNESDSKEGVSSNDIKAGIAGIAAESGRGPEEAASRMGGIHMSTAAGHPDYGTGGVIVCVDECQAIPEAIFKACVNLKSGSDYFKLISIGNIFFTTGNMLADRAEPRGGWSMVDEDAEEWENVRENSVTIRLNGERSPAMDDPDRYPYLIGPGHVRDILNEVKGNRDDPYYRSMVLALPSDLDTGLTVFPMVSQRKYGAGKPAVWASGRHDRVFLGVDPSWSADGDKAVVCVARTGWLDDGAFGIDVSDIRYLKLDEASKQPIQYQLSRQLIAIMSEVGCRLRDVAVDESASQLLCDVLVMESGERGVLRVNFAGRPSDTPVSVYTETTCRERYANLVAEMWFRVEQYAAFGHLRGLTGEAAMQFATRQTVPDKRPVRLEKKSDYKKRTRNGSPDEADAVAIAVYAATTRLFILPGAGRGVVAGTRRPWKARTSELADYVESDFSGNQFDI